MTISNRAYEGIRITAGSEVKPYEGKPRFRSTAQATGFVPFVDLRKAAQAACFETHRIAFVFFNGKAIPRGMVIRHSCDNPACCNPKHLVVGTHGDNREDMYARGRQAKGETIPQSKLTVPQVRLIKKCRHFKIFQRTLGEMFGVTQSTISEIYSGINWKHVEAS